ncbi:MAG: YgcG family protein [Leptolyngbyaceae cyanobacterium SM1_3_5]|nr:YgcG family protein [Leptolyngbyaceae cyanobacterium SM1_3_5]
MSFSFVIRPRQWLLAVAIALAAFVAVWLAGMSNAQATGVYSFPVSVDRSTFVVDEAEILSRLNEKNLSGQLDSLAKKTGNEVRFVTIHRLDYGETIDSFADQLFDQWFPTPEAKAHQTLIVLDEVTNTTAIRKGDETSLTDEIAASVVQETMLVPLRDGNKYNQAFVDASDRLVAVLSGQLDPGPPIVESSVQTKGTFATAEQTKAGATNYIGWVVGLLIAATIIPMATYYLYLVAQPAPSEPSDSSDS